MITAHYVNVTVGGERIHTFRNNSDIVLNLRQSKLVEALRYLPVALKPKDIKVYWVSAKFNEFVIIRVGNVTLMELFPEDAEYNNMKFYTYVNNVLLHLRKTLPEISPVK